MPKMLHELTTLMEDSVIRGSLAVEITKMTCDSRQVTPGSLFIALAGSKVDGHDFITTACRQGAVAVLVQKEVEIAECKGVTIIKVSDTRAAMQQIAPYFFDYPSQKLRMIGITGTNGKTTTTYLIRAILMRAGFRVGLIGTIQNIIDQQVFPVRNTTPDVIDLQALLADMVTAGVDYAVMEVSSHALALGRVVDTEFDVGVFTNMTRDHLDFHLTFENYIAAKSQLFQMLSLSSSTKKGKTAVVNVDDPASQAMLAQCSAKSISYGVSHSANLKAEEINVGASGAAFTVKGDFGILPLSLKITGVFNVYNVLAAMGATLAEGVEPLVIKKALEDFTSVPGRFELVDVGKPFAVIVDYAHTPDGLENILKTARQFAKNRVIVVFGCGGDRDRTKRPIMGKLAMEYGDVVIATSDNPRSENPSSILVEIEKGLQEGCTDGKNYEIIVERREAIKRALQVAKTDDVVIIAGKGHETYQILNDRTIDFDDRQVARDISRELK